MSCAPGYISPAAADVRLDKREKIIRRIGCGGGSREILAGVIWLIAFALVFRSDYFFWCIGFE